MAAIVFAMVTVVLLAVAVRQWSAPPPEAGSDESARNRWQGNLLFFLLSICLVVSVLLAAEVAGWSRDRALWISVGTFSRSHDADPPLVVLGELPGPLAAQSDRR